MEGKRFGRGRNAGYWEKGEKQVVTEGRGWKGNDIGKGREVGRKGGKGYLERERNRSQ